MMPSEWELWCQEATALIRYKPDKKAVSAELLEHLEDHRDRLIAQGISPQEAEQRALQAMGDPTEIGNQLAAIHRPWLGYFLSLIRSAAIIAVSLVIYFTVTSIWSLVFTIVNTNQFDSLPQNYESLDYYCHPMVSDYSDGRYFAVTEAAYSEDTSTFHAEIRIIYWPYLRNWSNLSEFWAVDSFGNYYASQTEAVYKPIPHLTTGGSSSTNLIGHYRLTITDFDCEAQWIELHYNRDGRDIVLYIDLTGGDEHGMA